jgi:hypothetical protein
MKLEEIHDLWAADNETPVVQFDLSINAVPLMHAKYLRIMSNERMLLRLIEEIVPKMTTQEISDKIAGKDLKENNVANEKLILDQPDTITNKGKIEHVVGDGSMKPINDSNNPSKSASDVLLTENPLDGVTIIKG